MREAQHMHQAADGAASNGKLLHSREPAHGQQRLHAIWVYMRRSCASAQGCASVRVKGWKRTLNVVPGVQLDDDLVVAVLEADGLLAAASVSGQHAPVQQRCGQFCLARRWSPDDRRAVAHSTPAAGLRGWAAGCRRQGMHPSKQGGGSSERAWVGPAARLHVGAVVVPHLAQLQPHGHLVLALGQDVVGAADLRRHGLFTDVSTARHGYSWQGVQACSR